ncbi:hypothetical protein [Flammeovirga aprica]|uniref:Uncharacterized protein n=1 Tax=Flammeovirga aprica JL-4 TaxID=694437 RepID=A0A7X9X9F7_9BACT|nr:hypothetical protein [Flammeovirga aprica]NME68817.1 hypothetical protein [Flammeovirga aprica JL-4]
MKNFTLILFLSLLHFNVFAQSNQKQKWNNSSCGTLSFFEDSLLIHIQENTFALKEASIGGEVNIEVTLYADYFDMLKGDIQMKDQKGIYVSGGMYDIKVTYEGEKTVFQKPVKVSYISDGINHFDGFRFNDQQKKWDNLKGPVLDYASTNSSSDDWGALQPQSSEQEGWDDGVSDWGWSAESEIASQWLYKTMNINSNGLYNYDYLIDKEELITYKVKVEEKNINKIYVYYPHLNTVIYYNVNSDSIVEDFALVDTDLSNVRIFTFDLLKNDKTKVWIGEIDSGVQLNLSPNKKLNYISFEISAHSLSKAAFDTHMSSL